MTVEETYLSGCYLLKPEIFIDERGSFIESYNELDFERKLGFKGAFVQDNLSHSKKGVLRGFHFQEGKYGQAKLVTVIKGEILDVVVDLRKKSPTYGKHYKIVLNDKTKCQLYIPRNFAHGFLALSDEVIFSYKCDNFYHKEYEKGIIYNDPDLAIDWGYKKEEVIVSDKDKRLPIFKDFIK